VSPKCSHTAGPDVAPLKGMTTVNQRPFMSGAVTLLLACAMWSSACDGTRSNPVSPTSTASCDLNIAPPTSPIASTGASGAVSVNATSNCSWSASSQTSWIELSDTSGVGPGAVKYRVAANTGGDRTGTFTIADEVVTVTQTAMTAAPPPTPPAPCEFSVSPKQVLVNASGGSSEIAVSASSSCAWTASSQAAWIAIGGNGGSGNGAVTLTIGANSGADRSGTLVVAGQTVTVTQSTSCSFAVTPTTYTAPPTAIENASFSVATSAGCAWTTTSRAEWIKVLHGSSATGNLTVIVGVDANTGGPRTGELTIAGRTVTINQQSFCSFAVDPGAVEDDGSGGAAEIAVSAPAGCGWTAVSNAPWITIRSGKSGSGAGIVGYEVAALPTGTTSRTGTIAVAGLTFTVRQTGK